MLFVQPQKIIPRPFNQWCESFCEAQYYKLREYILCYFIWNQLLFDTCPFDDVYITEQGFHPQLKKKVL